MAEDDPLFNDSDYIQNNTPQQEQAEFLYNLFLDKLDGIPDTILDIGCGDGTVTTSLAETFPSATVTGIDESGSQIEAARTHNSDLPNLTYETTDVLEYTPETPFDAVFSNAALHWVTDQEELYHHLHSITTDDATLAVHQGHVDCYKELRRAARQALAELGIVESPGDFEYPLAYHTRESITDLLLETGWGPKRVIVEDQSPPEGLIDAFVEDGLLPFRNAAPETREEEFLHRFRENAPDEDTVTVKRLYFGAVPDRDPDR